MYLTKYEKETIINFNAGEDVATLYTRDKSVMETLDRLVAEYPETYHFDRADDVSKSYSMPKSCIIYRKPRKITDEQRGQKRKLMESINNNNN